MPQIPGYDSTQNYGFTPLTGPNPSADSAADTAAAQGFAGLGHQAASYLADLQYRQQRNQQVTQASATSADASVKLAELAQQHSTDPDYLGAPARFAQAASTLRDQVVGGIQDPTVQSLVSRDLDTRIASARINFGSDMFRKGNAAQLSSNLSAADTFASAAANGQSDGEFDHNITAMTGVYAGSAAGGLMTPEQARQAASNGLMRALMLRGQNDASDASRLAGMYAGGITPEDTLRLGEFLQSRRIKQLGAAAAVGLPSATSGAPLPDGVADMSDVADRIIMAETNGDQSKQNTRSTAGGAGQFLDKTWLAVYRNTHGGAPGQSDADILALKTDPSQTGLQRSMTAAYAEQNADALDHAGLPVTPSSIYLAHVFGPGGATRLLRADPSTPVDQVLKPQVLTANPTLQNLTVAQVIASTDKRLGLTPSGGGGAIAPDLDAMLAQSARQAELIAPGDADVKDRGAAETMRNYHQWHAQTETARTALLGSLPDLHASLAAGNDAPIPADQLRALLPPAEAAEKTQSLTAARGAGQVLTSVQWGAPTDLDQAEHDLAAGTGRYADMVRGGPGRTLTGPGLDPQPQGAAPGPADGFRFRAQVLEQFIAARAKRDKALADDPAAYVAADPAVAPLLAKAQASSDPADQLAAQDAMTAEQRRLGVASPRLLTNGQVQSLKSTLLTTQAAKGDMGLALDGMAQRYGANWPQAFGELVKSGISPEWQTLANMNTPGQLVPRQDLQTALQTAAEKGGLARLQDTAPAKTMKDIRAGLDDTIAPFRDAYNDDRGVPVVATTRAAVEHLATLYAIRGQSASDALEHAWDGVIGRKYDFSGTVMAPKGQLPAVLAATDQIQRGLTAAGLQPIADTTTGLRTAAEQQDMALTQARRATWRPNEDASGLVLTRNGRDGATPPVLRADGSRVEIRFNALPAPEARPAATGSQAWQP